MRLTHYELNYEAEKPQLLLDDGDRFTIQTKPELIVERFVVLVGKDRTYNMKATLDFSEIPARWHGLALEMALEVGRSKLHLPAGA